MLHFWFRVSIGLRSEDANDATDRTRSSVGVLVVEVDDLANVESEEEGGSNKLERGGKDVVIHLHSRSVCGRKSKAMKLTFVRVAKTGCTCKTAANRYDEVPIKKIEMVKMSAVPAML